MKRIVLIILISVVLSSFQLIAQKQVSDLSDAPLIMVLNKTKSMAYPVGFEESDSTFVKSKGQAITRKEYFSRYTDRRNSVKGGLRITKINKRSISMTQNDTLRVKIKRQAKQNSGMIGAKKGTITREFIPSMNPAIPPSEMYMLDSDSSNFIIYRPELGLIEIEAINQVQYRRMIGNLFSDACNQPRTNNVSNKINKSLKEGDELQILYSYNSLSDDGSYFIQKPNKLLIIRLENYDLGTESTRINFNSKTIDIDHETVYDEKSSFIELFDGGLGIDEQVLIKDTLYPLTIKVSPPETEVRSDPFYPFFEFSGPTVEISYERSIQLNDSLLEVFSYWNSTNPGRFNVLKTFPFPWRDNAENFSGNPVFLKLGEKTFGRPFEINQNPNLHFSRVSLERDSLILDVFSNKLQNITIELQKSDGTIIKQLKQSYGIRKGITHFTFEKLDLPYGSQADIVLITKDKGESIEHQRFRYIQKN